MVYCANKWTGFCAIRMIKEVTNSICIDGFAPIQGKQLYRYSDTGRCRYNCNYMIYITDTFIIILYISMHGHCIHTNKHTKSTDIYTVE